MIKFSRYIVNNPLLWYNQLKYTLLGENMKNTKKLVALLLALMLIVSLTSCAFIKNILPGGDNSSSSKTEDTSDDDRSRDDDDKKSRDDDDKPTDESDEDDAATPDKTPEPRRSPPPRPRDTTPSGNTPAPATHTPAPPAPVISDLASKLIGIWDEIDIDNTYYFYEDGTGKEYFDGDTWEMIWMVDGNLLSMYFFDTGVEEYMITLDGDFLVVHNPNIDFEYVRR